MNLNLSIGNFFYPVPSNSPRTLCEKKLSPDSFSSLKWRILQNSCFSPRKKYFKIRYWIIYIFFLLIACSYRSHRRCLELIRRPCASRKVRAKLALEISTYLLLSSSDHSKAESNNCFDMCDERLLSLVNACRL